MKTAPRPRYSTSWKKPKTQRVAEYLDQIDQRVAWLKQRIPSARLDKRKEYEFELTQLEAERAQYENRDAELLADWNRSMQA